MVTSLLLHIFAYLLGLKAWSNKTIKVANRRNSCVINTIDSPNTSKFVTLKSTWERLARTMLSLPNLNKWTNKICVFL